MPVAVLISDMYGRLGDLAYLTDWARWLLARGYATRVIFVDDLLPEYFDEPATPFPQALHAQITAMNAVELAQSRLIDRVSSTCPDLLLGFSYGGYLAAGCRVQLQRKTKIVCISATRLRLLLPLETPPTVHAIFGANDPDKPQWRSSMVAGPHLRAIDIPDHGHAVYKHPDFCGEDVERILLAQNAVRCA